MSFAQLHAEEVPKVLLSRSQLGCSKALTWSSSSSWKKQADPHFVATQMEWQVANPFCKSLRTPKARLHVGMQNCQPIREHQFEFANLEKKHAET